MKVMIVGAGGFLGRHLLHRLESKGHNVLAVSSSQAGGIDPGTGLLPPHFHIPPDVGAVVYLAQSPRIRELPESAAHLMAVNTHAAIHVATEARRVGVPRLLYASTGNVYRPSFAPLRETDPLRRDDWYALSKIHAEEALALFRADLDITMIRLFGIYGPGQSQRIVPNIIDAVVHGREITLEGNPVDPADHDGLRISLLYVDDAVEIFGRLLESTRIDTLNVASDVSVSLRTLAESVARAVRVEPNLRRIDRFRTGDLIADVSRLRSILNPTFTPLQIALEHVLSATSGANCVR